MENKKTMRTFKNKYSDILYCSLFHYYSIMKERAEVEKRSKLNTTCFIKWIKTRFLNENRNNNKYLYLPEELVKENSI